MAGKLTARLITAVAASMIVLSAGITAAAPAQADTVGQCAGPFWGVYEQDVCVYVVTGAKNYASHTELVISVQVGNKLGQQGAELEAWGGNGRGGVAFYFNGRTLSISRTVNTWIPSGAGVCGAMDPVEAGDSREVACITIKV